MEMQDPKIARKRNPEMDAMSKIMRVLKELPHDRALHVMETLDTSDPDELEAVAKLGVTFTALNESARARVMAYVRDHFSEPTSQ
jgi:hypothetical protein